MTDTPELLRAHHLKTLKLPTFLREYDKLARQCAVPVLISRSRKEVSDHVSISLGVASVRRKFAGL